VFPEPTVQLSECLQIVETQRADPDLRPVLETHALRNADEAGIRLSPKVFDLGIRDAVEPLHYVADRLAAELLHCFLVQRCLLG
jgi:hypothetical protein